MKKMIVLIMALLAFEAMAKDMNKVGICSGKFRNKSVTFSLFANNDFSEAMILRKYKNNIKLVKSDVILDVDGSPVFSNNDFNLNTIISHENANDVTALAKRRYIIDVECIHERTTILEDLVCKRTMESIDYFRNMKPPFGMMCNSAPQGSGCYSDMQFMYMEYLADIEEMKQRQKVWSRICM